MVAGEWLGTEAVACAARGLDGIIARSKDLHGKEKSAKNRTKTVTGAQKDERRRKKAKFLFHCEPIGR